MGYDDRREILERLESLERMLRSRHDERGGRDEHRRGGYGGRDERRRGEYGRRRRDRDGDERRQRGDHDEKRIIDTIVHLVVENLDRHLQDRQARAHRRDGGDEKRIVDLIVGLVSEHVREIVVTELDRRVGPPAPPAECDDEPTGDREED